MRSKTALLACAVALCACSSNYEEAQEMVPAVSVASIVQQPRLQAPPDDSSDARPELDLLEGNPVALAATAHGLVAFDPGNGAVLGQADTPYQVVDLAHDPWRDRWIAAEYDDDSLARVSVWRLARRGLVAGRLKLDRTIEAGGYSRVIAARSSTVVFEHDGMHQRWMIWAVNGRPAGSSFQAPMPSGVVVRSDAVATRLLSVSTTDDGSGPRATWHSVRVQGAAAGPMLARALPAWSGAQSPVRAADAGAGRIALAQVRNGLLSVGLLDDHGQALRDPTQLDLHEAQAVEDLVVDPAKAIALIAVSSPDRLVAVDLEQGALLDQRGCALPTGAALWFSRLIGYDPLRGRMIVAGDQGLAAWDLSGTHKLEEVVGFRVAGARRPIALSASRSGRSP